MSDWFSFKTVVFDVDGTLIDSNGAHADSWAQALREYGVSVSATSIRPLIGMGGDKLLPLVARIEEGSAAGRLVSQRKQQLFEMQLPDLRPTEGARLLVKHLRDKNVQLAIATSADEREMSALLKRAEVEDLVQRRVSKDDAQESKPAPDIVQSAIQRARADLLTTVMIGDTPYDVEAARRAGIKSIALRCGGFWSDTELGGAIAIFDDPANLLKAIEGSS